VNVSLAGRPVMPESLSLRGEAARLIGWLVLPLAVGGLSGFVTAGSVAGWYQTLAAPPFAPPDWVFGPVWTALYLMMGLAAYLATRAARRSAADERISHLAVALFLVQLALNGLWSILFFGLHSPGLALVEIVLLWLAIGLTARQFSRLSRPAAALLLPYWAWVSFATVLNGGFWWLNR
jgi:tryptophan-rich sensory protein